MRIRPLNLLLGATVAFALATSLLLDVAYADTTLEDRKAERRTPAVEIYQKYREAVVFVTGPMFKSREPSMDEFFAKPGKNPTEQSVGTGFIVHKSGYVLTNAHGAEKVIFPEVVLANDRKYPAELVASLHDQDLALLKLDVAQPLVAVPFALSDDLMIGETIIVIGHPHGLRHTCTSGLLSATDRNTDLADIKGLTLHDMIQTDAGINPGSSGGPWFNILGETIGITTSKKQDADDIAFAVPTSTIRQWLPIMLDVERRHGLKIGLRLADDGPCRIVEVLPETPAATAGLKVDDLLEQLDKQTLPTVLDYHFGLIGRKPGESISLTFSRGGQSIETSLTLAQRPKLDTSALVNERLGFSVAPLNAAKIKKMRLRIPRGVTINAIDLRRYQTVEHKPVVGDVLARINKIRPRDLDHLGQIVEKIQPGETVTMVVLHHENQTATRVDITLVLPKSAGGKF